MKKLTLLLFLFFPFFCFGQLVFDIGTGIKKCYPLLNMTAGYSINIGNHNDDNRAHNSICAELILSSPVNSTAVVTYGGIFGYKVSYNFHNFFPGIGRYTIYKGRSNKELNKKVFIPSLKYVFTLKKQEGTGIYIDAMYYEKPQITVGFHVLLITD